MWQMGSARQQHTAFNRAIRSVSTRMTNLNPVPHALLYFHPCSPLHQVLAVAPVLAVVFPGGQAVQVVVGFVALPLLEE